MAMLVKNNILQPDDGVTSTEDGAFLHYPLIAGIFCYDGIRHSSRAVVAVGDQVGQGWHVGEVRRQPDGRLMYNDYSGNSVLVDTAYDALNS